MIAGQSIVQATTFMIFTPAPSADTTAVWHSLNAIAPCVQSCRALARAEAASVPPTPSTLRTLSLLLPPIVKVMHLFLTSSNEARYSMTASLAFPSCAWAWTAMFKHSSDSVKPAACRRNDRYEQSPSCGLNVTIYYPTMSCSFSIQRHVDERPQVHGDLWTFTLAPGLACTVRVQLSVSTCLMYAGSWIDD